MIVKDQIKEHYDRHKTIYNIVGTGLVIFTTVIITRRIVRRNISVCDHLSGQRMDATTLVDNSGINVSSSIFQNSQVANTIINNSIWTLLRICLQGAIPVKAGVIFKEEKKKYFFPRFLPLKRKRKIYFCISNLLFGVSFFKSSFFSLGL